MNETIKPSAIQGNIIANSSKSMMQRSIAIATLAEGTSTIYNQSFCNDSLAAMEVAKNLGATVEKYTNHVVITGGFKPRSKILNCGESGLCIRMFSPIAALHNKPITLTGEGSLMKRPLDMLQISLQEFGIRCKTQNGYLPITVCGPYENTMGLIDGSVSSQVLTGLLIALPLKKKDTELRVNNLKSKPYIDMTLQAVRAFGIEIENNDYKSFYIYGRQKYIAREYEVEGDWSGAAFLLIAGAIGGSVTVNKLQAASLQADKAVLEVLANVGATIDIQPNSIAVSRNLLKAFEYNAVDCPDLFPPLVALAANCDGVSKIWGVNRLIHKESNRAEALVTEFSKIGVEIQVDNDLMTIKGGAISGGTINSHNDHRIAMAGAVAALNAKAPILIENAECVAKSYPEFFEHLKQITVNT